MDLDSDSDPIHNNGDDQSLTGAGESTSPAETTASEASATSGGPVVGPRCAPTYTVVQCVIEKKEDGPGPRCGHTLTAVPAVGEEGSENYVGPRLILFGGATALEGNSAASAAAPAPSSPGSAGIRTFFVFSSIPY